MSTAFPDTSAPCPPACPPTPTGDNFFARFFATGVLVAVYYVLREPLAGWLGAQSSPRVVGMVALLVGMFFVWRPVIVARPKLHPPILITVILALSDASYSVLENHPAPAWLVGFTGGAVLEYSPTFLTICVTMLTELLAGRFFWGKWPNLTSAYISGISAGILIKSPLLWPFILCGVISIVSKYALRVGGRHVWNPTNFGVTMMLFLAPQHIASLSVQAGNNGLAVVAIWILGGMVMLKLKRFHIPLAFIAAFVPLALLRSAVTGHPWQTELAPITSPMFQLYIFFMITDPQTTTRARWGQVLVAVLVAVAETVARLAFKDVHSLYHALFFVGPMANLVEIAAARLRRPAAARPALTPS